jgi:hypothetical protein
MYRVACTFNRKKAPLLFLPLCLPRRAAAHTRPAPAVGFRAAPAGPPTGAGRRARRLALQPRGRSPIPTWGRGADDGLGVRGTGNSRSSHCYSRLQPQQQPAIATAVCHWNRELAWTRLQPPLSAGPHVTLQRRLAKEGKEEDEGMLYVLHCECEVTFRMRSNKYSNLKLNRQSGYFPSQADRASVP